MHYILILLLWSILSFIPSPFLSYIDFVVIGVSSESDSLIDPNEIWGNLFISLIMILILKTPLESSNLGVKTALKYC